MRCIPLAAWRATLSLKIGRVAAADRKLAIIGQGMWLSVDGLSEMTRRQVHEVWGRFGDLATASLIENWIDETERTAWFLVETISQS